MERAKVLTEKDVQQAEKIMSVAKKAAKQLLPGNTEDAVIARDRLTSIIIEQTIRAKGLNGQSGANREVSKEQEATL